jgi:hypothetical protein|eukprot:COSAG01_NODE_5782_length_4035_cov_4.660569_2_plen_697_part_00
MTGLGQYQLSAEQERRFLATGYLIFAVDDVAPEIHRRIYQQACELHRSGKPIQGPELAADTDAIIRSAATRGVLSGLLGPDFVGSAWNGGVLASSDRDQSFHKDNTHRATREHAPRHVSLFYYPGPVSESDGPTAFIPGSTYWSVDRAGLGMGEERLDPPLIPPPEGWSHRQWAEAVAQHEDGPAFSSNTDATIPYAAHDQRLRAADRLLGVPGLTGHSVTHAGGVCVLWHDDIVHRKSRQRPGGNSDLGPNPTNADLSRNPGYGVSFRPIIRLGFHRCTEPHALPAAAVPDVALEDWAGAVAEHGPPLACDALVDTATHVWSRHLTWLCGGSAEPPAVELPTVEVARLEAAFLAAGSKEATRIAAAYGLGRSGALDTLVAQLDCHGQERLFRAATYGLASAAGDRAVPALCAALRAASPDAERPLYRKEKMAHALGHAAGPPSLGAAMASLAAATASAWSEIDTIVGMVPTEERAELIATSKRGLRGYDGQVFFTIVPQHHRCSDARSLLAESAQASGLLASRAMTAEAAGHLSATESAQICRSAVLLIRELLVRPDEGSMLPSRFPLNMLENNAVEAMMQMCSSPVCPPAILPPDRPMDLPPNFTSIKANHPYAAAAEGPPRAPREQLGRQVVVGPTRNPRLRLAFARLAWLGKKEALRGPTGQAAVLDECKRDPHWRPLLDAGELLFPTAPAS